MKPADLIDRDLEWRALEEVWKSAKPELAFVLGRRRAGKSYLLTRFVQAHHGIYYQATKQTPLEQLRTISGIIGERFDDSAYRFGATFERWEDVFGYVLQRTGPKPLVIVLDEFPFLTEADPALPSVIQALWDHPIARTRIKLILSGSHVSAMRRLSAGDQPLHGRRTLQLVVHPMNYRDSAAFLPRYAPRDRLLAYGIFGGLPGHLATLDPARPLAGNVCRHMLAPTSRLYDEAAHLFDVFLSDGAVHYSIVEAIATGEHLWSKIANRVGKTPASVTRALDWLIEMQVVTRVAPITELPTPSHKSVRYRLTDPYLKFWHRFVAPAKAMGMLEAGTPEDVWALHIAPELDRYMGDVFEEVCRTFVRLDQGKTLPFRAVQVGEWWTTASDAQVDVVAYGAKGELLVGECKWGAVSREDVALLRTRAEQIVRQRPETTGVTYVVFTGGGVRDAKVREEIRDGRLVHVDVAGL